MALSRQTILDRSSRTSARNVWIARAPRPPLHPPRQRRPSGRRNLDRTHFRSVAHIVRSPALARSNTCAVHTARRCIADSGALRSLRGHATR